MSKTEPRSPLEQDSDYDGAWKEAARGHLQACLAKYHPQEHAVIDWSRGVEWLDKELSQIIGHPNQRNRRVDLLAKVFLLSGEEQWILLHLEIQTSPEDDFALRLSRYNSGIFWVLGRRALRRDPLLLRRAVLGCPLLAWVAVAA